MFELFIITIMIGGTFFVFRSTATTKEEVEARKADAQAKQDRVAKRNQERAEWIAKNNAWLEESDKFWTKFNNK